jgi:precorrin-6B methylase 2
MNGYKIFSNKENNYSLIDKYKIKKANIYWKIIDNLSFISKKFAKRYEEDISKEYKDEIKRFKLNNSKNILHIGCGSYPISAITFSKIKDSKVVAIDKNKSAVKKAREIITRKKLNDKIKIKKGDGSSFSIKDFDTIIISGCAIPKTKILKNIFENAKPETKIIVREQNRLSKIILKIAKKYKDIKIVKQMENKPSTKYSWESFYFLKK